MISLQNYMQKISEKNAEIAHFA